MFPIDPRTGDWDAARMARFDALIAPRGLGWTLRDILPDVRLAGRPAGRLSAEGARLLDPSGRLPGRDPAVPPEGDAGTGMVATNAVRPRSGNVSAGTSVFAMVVLEQSLARVHEEIDIVVTPDGQPVAMVHSNNGSSDLDAWIALFGQVARALGVEARPEDLYDQILPLAVVADPDAGGLLSINYVSGEHLTGFTEGRPLFVRNQDGSFTLENFVRALYFASLCALRTGLDILTEQEGVVIEEIRGHGGNLGRSDDEPDAPETDRYPRAVGSRHACGSVPVLRSHATFGMVRDDAFGGWLVSGYHDVRAALLDRRLASRLADIDGNHGPGAACLELVDESVGYAKNFNERTPVALRVTF